MASTTSAKCLAEFIGTFALIFIGAGSVCVAQLPGVDMGLVGVALAHGLTIFVMAAAFGHVSGGHFNPSVTVMTVVTRRLAPAVGIAYVAAQLAGAVVAAFILRKSISPGYWEAVHLGTTAPGHGMGEFGVFAIETILTFFLATAVLGAAADPRGSRAGALAVGATVTLDILLGGPLTGAGMNPARTFGPALASQWWEAHWAYWAGPCLGAVTAGIAYDFLLAPPEPKT